MRYPPPPAPPVIVQYLSEWYRKGVSHPFLLVFVWYRAIIAEIPLLQGGHRTSSAHAGGRGVAPESLRFEFESPKTPYRGIFTFSGIFSRTSWYQSPPDRGQSRKIRFTKFPGSDWKKFSEPCVLLFFLGKTDKMIPKSRFSKPIFGHSAGSTKLDRPYCKRFWWCPFS